jgi:hydroxymethylbilane synthase
MSRPPLRLGTRKSPMAMAQSATVASLITERTGAGVELVGLTSFGDASQAQLTQIGGTGVFVSALRECLLAGDIDLAVHSLKDLPTAGRAGGQGRRQAGGPARRGADRHRIAPPGRPAAADAPGRPPGAGARQRRHAAGEGDVR